MRKFYNESIGFTSQRKPTCITPAIQRWVGLFAFVLIFGLYAKAQDCGTGDTIIWDVDQNINGVFELAPEDILQIEPGVNVVFETTESGLSIQGTILAVGTDADPVSFSGALPEGWSGIDLTNACPSQFVYCNFSGINRGGAELEYSRAVAGIEISGTDDVLFENCSFTENNDGIVILNSMGILLESCTFANNEILPGQYGLVTIEGSSSDTIRNCLFQSNKTNLRGVVCVLNGSTAVIQNNTFVSTSFFNPVFNGAIYAVINLKQSTAPNLLIVNNNEFSETTVPQNNRLCEISIFGNQDNIEFSNALIWNNTFVGYPSPTPGQPDKTAIRANYSVLAISHNTISYYNRSGIEVLVSEAKINLNTFNENTTDYGAVYLDEYKNYSGREINNVIFANVFTNNAAPNAPAILSKVLPNQNIITTIDQNVFTGNEAVDGKGGAIYDMYGSQMMITNNQFNQNSADAGGAICVGHNETGEIVETVIRENTFFQNTATGFGGAIYANRSMITIQENVISENQATLGGGIFIDGAMAASAKHMRAAINITDNVIRNNVYVEAGGGCYLLNCSDIAFTRNFVGGNTTFGTPTSQIGGGMYANACDLEMYNSHFIGNQSGADLGGVYLAMDAENTLVVQNCNVSGHGDAGGIVFGSTVATQNVDIYNTIFFDNNDGATGKSVVYSGSEPVTTTNCYFDVLPASYDVNFVDELVNSEPGWIGSGDYYLDCDNSVCVDSGNPDEAFNDLPGANPDEALFPSCGNLVNDIGISGGPFALDVPALFQTDIVLDKNQETALELSEQTKSAALVSGNAVESIRVFPNPTSGLFNISFEDTAFENGDLSITDAAGRLILRKHIPEISRNLSVDLTGEQPGIYLVQFISGHKVFTQTVLLK